MSVNFDPLLFTFIPPLPGGMHICRPLVPLPQCRITLQLQLVAPYQTDINKCFEMTHGYNSINGGREDTDQSSFILTGSPFKIRLHRDLSRFGSCTFT